MNHAISLQALPNCSIQVAEDANVRRGHTDHATPSTPEVVMPDIAQAWFQLGNRYAEQQCWTAALWSYQQALNYQANPKVLHNLGLTHVQQGMEILHQARRQLPDHDPVHAQTRDYLRLLLETF